MKDTTHDTHDHDEIIAEVEKLLRSKKFTVHVQSGKEGWKTLSAEDTETGTKLVLHITNQGEVAPMAAGANKEPLPAMHIRPTSPLDEAAESAQSIAASIQTNGTTMHVGGSDTVSTGPAHVEKNVCRMC